MRILVCGGTGFIGRHIVDSLKQAGHEPVQQPPHGAPLDFSKALTAEAWLPHLAGIDAAINAVGVLRDSAGRPLQAMHADAPSRCSMPARRRACGGWCRSRPWASRTAPRATPAPSAPPTSICWR